MFMINIKCYNNIIIFRKKVSIKEGLIIFDLNLSKIILKTNSLANSY